MTNVRIVVTPKEKSCPAGRPDKKGKLHLLLDMPLCSLLQSRHQLCTLGNLAWKSHHLHTYSRFGDGKMYMFFCFVCLYLLLKRHHYMQFVKCAVLMVDDVLYKSPSLFLLVCYIEKHPSFWHLCNGGRLQSNQSVNCLPLFRSCVRIEVAILGCPS